MSDAQRDRDGHTPTPYATSDTLGGVRCSCGWTRATRIKMGGRVTMRMSWNSWRRHWSEANPPSDPTPAPRPEMSEQPEMFPDT